MYRGRWRVSGLGGESVTLGKYSLGVGDRYAHQGRAQLAACMRAAERGVVITPVWNKSNREHKIVGSHPSSTRAAADAAVAGLGWAHAWHVDADHINLDTVERFLESSDFFTIDVADAIGRPVNGQFVADFMRRHAELKSARAEAAAGKYLLAVREAGRIYRGIAAAKPADTFITEVSMDETDSPQTPDELLLILAAIADEGIPIQTIAPKFTGRFNKGVDYVGDVEQFEREFTADLAAIAEAIERYHLPANLKLSVHSGSDKFSLYGPIRRALEKSGAGVHLKTAGTTWLEELIGLAEAGADGLALAKEIYAGAFEHRAELCAPYASVIDIDAARLPAAGVVSGWTSQEYAGALRHDQANPAFNPHLRQLLHVGYKIAAAMGERYTKMLRECEEPIARNVTENLYARHIAPLFLGLS
jgi:hypothetical protein